MSSPPESPASQRNVLVGVAATVLALLLAVLGGQEWPLPQRTSAGAQVTDVPGSLVVFLLLSAGICLAVAGRLVAPGASLGSRREAGAWWALVAVSALVSIWNDLYLAALAGSGAGAVIPVFDWAFTLLPAVLAGALARRHGPAVRIRAALGTGVVSLPMFALGWALLGSPASSPAGLGDVLRVTAVLGLLPLAMAVTLVAGGRRRRAG